MLQEISDRPGLIRRLNRATAYGYATDHIDTRGCVFWTEAHPYTPPPQKNVRRGNLLTFGVLVIFLLFVIGGLLPKIGAI